MGRSETDQSQIETSNTKQPNTMSDFSAETLYSSSLFLSRSCFLDQICLVFNHLIPLAQRHILYTLTCSLSAHLSSFLEKSDTFGVLLFCLVFLTVTVIFCRCDALLVFVTIDHRVILRFCSEYTTVTEYHFHYSVLYVFFGV